ncbi:unnamed protein product, partial [Didymodactylos carnosus]
ALSLQNFRPQHHAQQQPLPSQHIQGGYPQFHQHCTQSMAAAMQQVRLYSVSQSQQPTLSFPQQSTISPYQTPVHP